MTIDPSLWILVVLFFVIIAAIYSAVGFGGGSSYLAILSLLGFSFFFIRTNALLCNLVVVSASSFLFYKNKIISFKDVLPFIVASIPMTFIGASLRLDESIFFVLLAITLIGSSFSLLWQTFLNKKENQKNHKISLLYKLCTRSINRYPFGFGWNWRRGIFIANIKSFKMGKTDENSRSYCIFYIS